MHPSPAASSFFFFYPHGHPRDLHSFPTRRSSDLAPYRLLALTNHSLGVESSNHPVAFSEPALAGSRSGSENRSEEHTSELQSRGHLVCRLLLEKKKKSKRCEKRWDEATLASTRLI